MARFRPTLRLTISVVLAVMILVTATVQAVSSYITARGALVQFSVDLIGQNARVVKEQVNGFLRPARSAAELTLALALAQRGMIEVDDPDRLEEYFFDFLVVHRTVSMLNYGDTDGNFVMVKRQADGSLSTKRIRVDGGRRTVVWRHRDPGASLEPPREEVVDPADDYDARTRLWYEGAVETGALHWTRVYVFHSDQQPGITVSIPHRGPDGGLRGVLSVDIGLLDLSHFLADQIRVGRSGEAFLLDEIEQVVAVRDVDALRVPDDRGGSRLRRLAESPRPEIAALAEVPAVRRFLAGAFDREDVAPLTVRYQAGGVDYVGTLLPIEVGDARTWVAGVVAREDEFLGAARRANRNALIGAIGFAAVALVVGFLLAQMIARSLRTLVDESARVRRMELDATGARSTFREVDEVLGAFEGMKVGLRAFEKYVPMRLVRQLLERQQDPALGGESRTLTILFTDIRGFTTLSEQLRPLELARQLGDYLSIVTRQIQDRHGTVDKYIGDAVMAFWGAPQEVRDHPVEACRAALDILAAIRDVEPELPHLAGFYTRIGIHTAEVVVGNFGSDDRLSYTIIGDGVNLANRLEGVNKLFGTQIALSDETAAQVGDRVETRRLAPVAVAGRATPCTVHELLGVRGEVPPDRVADAREYERALDRYLARDFATAIAILEALRVRRPDDAAAGWLLARCRALAEAPPPAEWNGVVTMEGK